MKFYLMDAEDATEIIGRYSFWYDNTDLESLGLRIAYPKHYQLSNNIPFFPYDKEEFTSVFVNWCTENCLGKWCVHDSCIFIEQESDAMLFKLTWC